MDEEYAPPGLPIRIADVDETIEPAGTEQCRVDHVRAVGGGDDHDVVEPFETVHLGEKLADDPFGHSGIGTGATEGGDGIELVQEDDGRGRLLRLAEGLADGLLAFPHPLAQELGTLHRDEVCLALGGNGLGEEGLPRPRGAVQQDTPGGFRLKVAEEGLVLQGPFHHLPELLFLFLEPADVFPPDVRALDEYLPHGGGFHLPEGIEEITPGNGEPVQKFDGHCLVSGIDLGQDPSQGTHGSLLGQGGHIGSGVTVGEARDLLDGHVGLQWHPPGVDLEDDGPPPAVRDPDLDLPVQATGTPEGRVQGVLPVGGPDDDDLAPGLQTVHEGKELCHHPLFHLPPHLVTLRCDGIDLVDEDDGGGLLLRLLEDGAEVLLALTVEFGHDLGPAEDVEVGLRFRGHGLGKEGLPGTGGTVQENALRRLHPELLEDLGVAQGQFDHLPHLPDLLVQSPDILVGDSVHGGDLLGFLPEDDVRSLVDEDTFGGG